METRRRWGQEEGAVSLVAWCYMAGKLRNRSFQPPEGQQKAHLTDGCAREQLMRFK